MLDYYTGGGVVRLLLTMDAAAVVTSTELQLAGGHEGEEGGLAGHEEEQAAPAVPRARRAPDAVHEHGRVAGGVELHDQVHVGDVSGGGNVLGGSFAGEIS